MQLLCEIVINDFPTQIKVSEKRRAIYYRRGGSRKLPKTYRDKTKYKFDKEGYLIKLETEERVLANPRTAGKPRYQVINGQSYYNRSIHFSVRTAVKNELEKLFTKHLKVLPGFTKFPLIIEGEMYRPVKNTDKWDMDNIQVPYVKAFHDSLVAVGLIPDDRAKYISKPLSFLLTPSDKCKFVIRFYHDDRKIWNE